MTILSKARNTNYVRVFHCHGNVFLALFYFNDKLFDSHKGRPPSVKTYLDHYNYPHHIPWAHIASKAPMYEKYYYLNHVSHFIKPQRMKSDK